MKRPLGGPFLGRFYFYAHTLQTMSKGCCIWNSFTFGILVHEKKSFTSISYINPCKMKHPFLGVGPFLGRIYFYEQTLQTISQRCCMSNIRVFGLPVHEKKIFLKFTKFYPIKCQPLNFHKLESPFPKNTSYQIWLKSVQWFWRRSCLKEKFTDGRRMDGQDMITIAKAQVS